MVRTGASAYVNYGYESTFGTASTALTKSFGLKTALTSLTLGTNRQQLYKLGQVEPHKYAYGQQTGSLSLDFVLGDTTSSDVFQAIYGVPTGSGTSASNHIYGDDTGSGSSTTFANQTFTTELGFDTEDSIGYIVRQFKGCILNGFGITAVVGDVIKCTGEVIFGKEGTATTAANTFSDDAVENSAPFTFAHGTLKLNGVVQGQIQEVDLNFAQNGELLYEIGSNQSVAGIKKTLDITGRFKVAWSTATAHATIIAQLAGADYKETWGDKNSGTPEISLEFNNGLSGASERRILIIGKGLGLSDQSISGLEPIEAVFEELNFQIKSAEIQAINTE